ncbi:MAG: carboxypeptidase regulatory-like domain-containing protein [Acidobacteriota bacterium]
MSCTRFGVIGVLALLSAWLALQPAQAQVLYGTLVGAVEDQTGATVPRATVRVASNQTGQARETTTDGEGRYQFSNLLPGAYTLTVSGTGFRSHVKTGVEITINTVTRADVGLQVGQITESVTVAASGAVLQTEKADVHVELAGKEITDLPLPAYRNYQSLVNLVPGATPARTQNATIGSPGRALSTNVNGTTRNNNNNRLDGTNNIRSTLPHQAHYIPPADSIETVNVSTNSFDAEQGFAGGVAVNVITKSGTNDLHGTLFEYHSNSNLRAKDFFYRQAKKPKNILNMYGGTAGGPIRKDKLFYFVGFEGLRERQNESRLLTVPTADQRAGNFSAYGLTLYDPLTGATDGAGRTPFANATIPLARQSAITRKMQELIPPANQPGTSNNYFASKPVVFDRDNYDAKINWNLSQQTAIWGKYSAMGSDVIGEPSLDKAGGPGFPWGAGRGDILGQLATLAANHTFSPNFVMDANLGFARMAVEILGNDIGQNFGLEVLGIPGANGPDPRQGGIPHFSVSGYTPLGQVDSWMPKILYDNTWTYSMNFGWNKASHDIRFGVDIAREQQNHWHPELGDNGPRGRFRFEGGVTALRGGPAPVQYNYWASYLLGLPQRIGKSLQLLAMTPREWRQGYYFRDRWQVTRRLTFNLGLRWEFFPLMTNSNYGIPRYDPDDNKLYLGRFGGVPDNAGTSVSKKDFGPRVGLAYRVRESTVVRAGYGISVDPVPMSAGFFMLDAYPATINQDFAGANSFQPVGTIEKGIPAIPVPDIRTGIFDMPLDVTTKTLEKGLYNRGYIQSFNFIVERQLPAAFIGSIGYVATRTVGQLGNLNVNAAPPGGGTAGRALYGRFRRAVDTSMYKHFLPSRFDSLQVALDRRFSKGLMMKLAYTWGKAIDYTDDSGGGLSWNHLSQYQRNRAVAGFDRTHNFRLAWLAELPFGAGRRWASSAPVARALAGGWQVNGIFSSYSGPPFTVSASGTALNAPGNSQTADQILPQVKKLGGVGPGTPFFDPAAFASVRETRFGTTGRNILRGPGVVNLDLSLFRNFKLSERWKVQFRAESFNLTNTPHFATPGSSVESTSFMIVSSTTGTDTNLEGQSRGFRFGLRFNF